MSLEIEIDIRKRKMAREKKQKRTNEPRKQLAVMSVKKRPAPISRYIVVLVWNESLGRNDVRLRLNPEYNY
jgi:hypothetical protein